MGYKREPDKVFDDINRKLGDVIQTAITGGLFYACKQFKKNQKSLVYSLALLLALFANHIAGLFHSLNSSNQKHLISTLDVVVKLLSHGIRKLLNTEKPKPKRGKKLK